MKYRVPSVAASIQMVGLIAAGGAVGSIQAMARKLSITSSSCFRILRTLEHAGWVDEDEQGGRSIGHGLRRLAWVDDAEARLARSAREPLGELAVSSGLACKLSVRRRRQAVTLDRAEPTGTAFITSTLGATFTLCVGSSGAVLAAELSEAELDALAADPAVAHAWRYQSAAAFRARVRHARKHGWVADHGSYRPGVHSLSQVVRIDRGFTAAVTLLGMEQDFTPSKLRASRRLLSRCVRLITTGASSGRSYDSDPDRKARS